jgi:hypothetical protein
MKGIEPSTHSLMRSQPDQGATLLDLNISLLLKSIPHSFLQED